MAVSCLSLFLSPPPPPPSPAALPPLKSLRPLTAHNSRLSLIFPVNSPPQFSSNRVSHFRRNGVRRISAFPGNFNFLLSEADPVQNSPEIASMADTGTASIISTLLFIAFVGLSVLSIGVIYISVTDYLQKRESDKFKKEEEAKKKKKKSGKKGKVVSRARGGPRGFGQKIVDEDDDDDD